MNKKTYKTDEPEIIETKTEPTPLTPAYKFRYFCPACTGVAFYAIEPEKFTTRICKNCGHNVSYEPNNWIKMA